MTKLKKFKIWAEINLNEFMAEDEEEAKKLFWESIDDKYGVASNCELNSIEEQK